MKLLEKIIMVQWYLFEKQEIVIRNHTAIVGANGAGKSSIIDGVQLVLAGGDKSKISLNKGSNEKSMRTVREYCLGIVSDPNSSVRVPPRERANTYLVLCFRDQETLEYICAGVSIWSTLAEPKENIRGYFITKGECLAVEDFTSEEQGGTIALDWDRVRNRLLNRFPLEKKDIYNKDRGLLLPNQGPTDFARQFYTNMSAEPGAAMDAQTVVKSLLSAIAFKPIADTTAFVRRNMLEPADINIRELKESLSNWRSMCEKTQQTATHIEHLGKMEKYCTAVAKASEDVFLHRHASFSARIEMCYELASPVEDRLYEIGDEIKLLTGNLEEKRKEQEDVRLDLWQKKSDFERQDSTQRINQLKTDRANEIGSLEKIKNQIEQDRAACLRLDKVIGAKDSLPAPLTTAMNSLLASCHIEEGLLTQDWPRDPISLDQQVVDVQKHVAPAITTLKGNVSDLWNQISPLAQEIAALSVILSQLKKDRAPISEATQGLTVLLKSNRIDATPLCNLVDITDEAWRPVIEAILGNAREALIVPPERAQEAVRLYRYEGKEFRGGHVVNTNKVEEWTGRCREGSLAELVVTENPYARAFIDLRLGDIICVECEADLIGHKRAATTDMMFTTGGMTSMKQEPRYLILGKETRKKQKERLEKEIPAVEEKKDRLERLVEKTNGAVKVLESFIEWAGSERQLFAPMVESRMLAESRIKTITRDISLLEDKKDVQLESIINALQSAYDGLVTHIRQMDETLGERRTIHGRLQQEVESKHREAEVFAQTRQALEKEHPDLDLSVTADILEAIREKFSEESNAHLSTIKHIDWIIANKENFVKNGREKIIADLQEFLATYNVPASLNENGERKLLSYEDRVVFITEEKQRLEESTMANYVQKTADALIDVEQLFRDKFIGRIGERIREVKENIDGLNKILKNRPFNEEYFQFRAHAANDLKPVYDFALAFEKDRAALSAVGTLFDPEKDQSSPHWAAIDFIKKAFQDEDLGKKIQDYRNYYVFDVEMFSLEGKKTANLKHRIDKGSGGENMAPFYVAIGSSLAAAYKIMARPGRGAYGGMNLAPFDEAFSKLDMANIRSCLEFLKDVNLQVLLAAPDDKYTTLAAHVNTIVSVYRQGGNIDIEVEYLTDKTRKLLALDYPFAAPLIKEGESMPAVVAQ